MFTFEKSLSVLLNSKKGCKRFTKEVRKGNIEPNLYLQNEYQNIKEYEDCNWYVCYAASETYNEQELKTLFDVATIKPTEEILTQCLQTACVHGNKKVISYLIKIGAKIDETIFEATILNYRYEILKILLNNPNVNKIKNINKKLTKLLIDARKFCIFDQTEMIHSDDNDIKNLKRMNSLINKRIEQYIWL